MTDDDEIYSTSVPIEGWPQHLKFFELYGPDGFLLRFNLLDGTMEIGPGLTPDEAGMKALGAMRDAYGNWFSGAIAAEREACEKVAETITHTSYEGWLNNPRTDGCGGATAANNTGRAIVAAIRARKG